MDNILKTESADVPIQRLLTKLTFLQQDSKQQAERIKSLEYSLLAKDQIIKSLSGSNPEIKKEDNFTIIFEENKRIQTYCDEVIRSRNEAQSNLLLSK